MEYGKRIDMEWNMEWKIFSMEWMRNGTNFALWNMVNRVPFHSIACLIETSTLNVSNQRSEFNEVTWIYSQLLA